MQTTLKLLVSCLVCLSMTFFAGCGVEKNDSSIPQASASSSGSGEDNSSLPQTLEASPLIGTWETVDINGQRVSQEFAHEPWYFLTFQGDGTFIWGERATWTTHSSRLIITPVVGKGSDEFKFEVSGSTLILSQPHERFTFRRKQ